MPIELVIPSNYLTLCHPLFLLPSIFPRIRVFSNKLVLHIKWPKYWSFIFSISPSNEYLVLISLRIDCFDVFASVFFCQESFPAPQFKSISSSVLSLLYGPTLTSCIFFSPLGVVLTTSSYTMLWTSVHSSLDTLSDLLPWIFCHFYCIIIRDLI